MIPEVSEKLVNFVIDGARTWTANFTSSQGQVHRSISNSMLINIQFIEFVFITYRHAQKIAAKEGDNNHLYQHFSMMLYDNQVNSLIYTFFFATLPSLQGTSHHL